jgi:hypothetical protein
VLPRKELRIELADQLNGRKERYFVAISSINRYARGTEEKSNDSVSILARRIGKGNVNKLFARIHVPF